MLLDVTATRKTAKKLPLSFYQRDTTLVARELLGKRLVHQIGRKRLSGIIVETEAYIGAEDRACHGFGNRRTRRTESLFQEGGYSYVYMIYGMHFCFNAVTRTCDHPEAVLVRALQPNEGVSEMKRNRLVKSERELTSGPAKLCEALLIDKAQDRLSLVGSELFIEDINLQISSQDIVTKPRIGIAYAGEAAHWPLRFYICGNPFISKI